jgi:hypothetical protein
VPVLTKEDAEAGWSMVSNKEFTKDVLKIEQPIVSPTPKPATSIKASPALATCLKASLKETVKPPVLGAIVEPTYITKSSAVSDASDLKHLFATCVVENVALRPLTVSVVELCELAGDGTLHKLEAPIEKVSTTLPASRDKKTSYIPSIALKAPNTESQNAALPRTQNRVVVHGHGTACFAASWRNR